MEISTNLVLQRKSIAAQFPVGTFNKIAILGDSPGKQEVAYGIPFCGTGGNFLSSILHAQGIATRNSYLSYLVPSQIPNGSFASIAWGGREVTEGGQTIQEELARLQPNILLCLGPAALNYAKFGQAQPPRMRGKALSWKADLRGWSWKPFSLSCI